MDDRIVFVRVVEEGTFTEAARRLQISTSYASRRVRALEAALGVQLLARTTRQVRPTEAGRSYYARVAPLLQGLAEADVEVGAHAAEPRGLLRIAAPLAFGLAWVQPALVAFQRQWPRVELDASFSDRDQDPLAYDLLIRGGTLLDSSLVARRLVPFESWLAASPELVEALPPLRDPDPLGDLPAVAYTGYRTFEGWLFRRGSRTVRVQPRAAFRSDSGAAVIAAAEAGLGLAYQPDFLVAPAVVRGTLVRLLPEWETSTGAFWAITPSRVRTMATRALLDVLAERLSARPWLDVGVS